MVTTRCTRLNGEERHFFFPQLPCKDGWNGCVNESGRTLVRWLTAAAAREEGGCFKNAAQIFLRTVPLAAAQP